MVGASRAPSFHRKYRLILMTQPEASPPVPEEEQPRLAAANDSTSTAVSEADAESQPEPEPWTPERVIGMERLL